MSISDHGSPPCVWYWVAIIHERFSDIPCLGTAETCRGRVGRNLHWRTLSSLVSGKNLFVWNRASSAASMFAMFVLMCAQPTKPQH